MKSKSKLLCIKLDRESYTYCPGETITGKVIVNAEQQIETQGIELIFVGKAKLSSPGRDGYGAGDIQEYQEYFNLKSYILGREGHTAMIKVGRRDYPFKFQLPQGLPTEFTGKIGKVYYRIKAVIKMSWCERDKKFVQPFTVHGTFDLNAEPDATRPVCLQRRKNVGWWWENRPVGFTIAMPKRGYVPGEFLRFTVKVNNDSQRKLRIHFSLCQMISYIVLKGKNGIVSELSRDYERHVIFKFKPLEVNKNEYHISEEREFKLPYLPPKKLGGCELIDVDYYIRIEMEIPKFLYTSKLKGEALLILGTIPLQSNLRVHNTYPDLLTHGGSDWIMENQHPGPSFRLNIENPQE